MKDLIASSLKAQSRSNQFIHKCFIKNILIFQSEVISSFTTPSTGYSSQFKVNYIHIKSNQLTNIHCLSIFSACLCLSPSSPFSFFFLSGDWQTELPLPSVFLVIYNPEVTCYHRSFHTLFPLLKSIYIMFHYLGFANAKYLGS